MTEFVASTILRRNPQLLSVEMDGDLVMMSIETGNYFGVSGIGPVIWEFLETPKSFAQVVNEICDKFEVEPDKASEDLVQFAAKLADNGMIEVG